jgi:hypothetical protein
MRAFILQLSLVLHDFPDLCSSLNGSNGFAHRSLLHASSSSFLSVPARLSLKLTKERTSGARLFFQISLENRHISLDFSLEILDPQNFPSISAKFP